MTNPLQGSSRRQYSDDSGAAVLSFFYDEWGFRYLSKKFGVTRDEMQRILQRVGGRIEDVEHELERLTKTADAA
jgi:hypothetical protein